MKQCFSGLYLVLPETHEKKESIQKRVQSLSEDTLEDYKKYKF